MENLVPSVTRRHKPLPDVDDHTVGRLLVETALDQEALEKAQQRLEAVKLGDLLLPVLHLHCDAFSLGFRLT